MNNVEQNQNVTSDTLTNEVNVVTGEVVEYPAIVITTPSLIAVTDKAEDLLNLLQKHDYYEPMTIAKVNTLTEALQIQQSYLGAKAIMSQIGQRTMSIPEIAPGSNMQMVPQAIQEGKYKLLKSLLGK